MNRARGLCHQCGAPAWTKRAKYCLEHRPYTDAQVARMVRYRLSSRGKFTARAQYLHRRYGAPVLTVADISSTLADLKAMFSGETNIPDVALSLRALSACFENSSGAKLSMRDRDDAQVLLALVRANVFGIESHYLELASMVSTGHRQATTQAVMRLRKGGLKIRTEIRYYLDECQRGAMKRHAAPLTRADVVDDGKVA